MADAISVERLKAFYQIHDPSKIDEVEAIMDIFHGKTKKMLEHLQDQYNASPLDPMPGFPAEEDHHDKNHAFTNSSLGLMLTDLAHQTGDVSNMVDETWKGRGKRKKHLKKMQDALADRLHFAETGVKVASKHSEISVDICPVSTFDMSGDDSIADVPLFRLMLDGLGKSPCFANFIQISLQSVDLSSMHVVALMQYLTPDSHIKRLNLSGNPITKGVLRVSKHMVPPYTLDDYTTDTRGLHAICQHMKHTTTLSHLYLENCRLDFEATRDLMKAILANEAIVPPSKPLLRKLDLSNNILGIHVRKRMATRIDDVLNEGKLPKKIVFLCDQDEEPPVEEDEDLNEDGGYEDYGGGYDTQTQQDYSAYEPQQQAPAYDYDQQQQQQGGYYDGGAAAGYSEGL